MNGENKCYRLVFGPYLVVVNANNSDKGVIPIVNVLRDPHWKFAENCDEYKQVWHGDLVEFYDMLEAKGR